VVANNWYCMVLAVISIGAIFTGLPKIKTQASRAVA